MFFLYLFIICLFINLFFPNDSTQGINEISNDAITRVLELVQKRESKSGI